MGKKSKISLKPSKINFKKILAIETSCDDTSVAIVDSEGFVFGMESQNQDSIHLPFGGVIPELACRNHTMRLVPLIEKVFSQTEIKWSEIDGIAVTSRPGLLGALLVGVTVAKSLSLIHEIPVIGINHLEGHLYAPFLKDDGFDLKVTDDIPFLGLCVSGGHTSLVKVSSFGKYTVLGRTLDDAAGEAFDKFGKVLGLGYPAGRQVDNLAQGGNKTAFKFPRPLLKKPGFDFSFSGLKTAGSLEIQKLKLNGQNLDKLSADLCASYQEAVVDVLIEKLEKALRFTSLKRAVITGGVSCNSRLRERAYALGKSLSVEILISPPKYCTDNAAMIGLVGVKRLQRGEKDGLKLTAQGTSRKQELW